MKKIVSCLLMLACLLTMLAGTASAADEGWIKELAEPTDYAYSIAVVGDTQIACKGQALKYIYRYIAQNAEAKKLKHVLGVGDITDGNTDHEWEHAVKQITRMDGVVSYSLARGNHDGAANFDTYFGEDSTYAKQYKENYLSTVNTAHEFTAGNRDYLVVVLDWYAKNDVLDWANDVIARHPNHNVIISTHAYLNVDGTTIDGTDDKDQQPLSLGYNSGQTMWEKLISKHPNITMVFSGHLIAENHDIVMTQQKGEHGNTVTSMLINPQLLDALSGNTCMVAMLYFSEDGKNVDLQYYSTHYEMFYRAENQFSFTVDVVERGTYPEPTTTTTKSTTKATEKATTTTKSTTATKAEGTTNTAVSTTADAADTTATPEATTAPSAEDETSVTTEASADMETSATEPEASVEDSVTTTAPLEDASQTGGDVTDDNDGPGVWLWVALGVAAVAAIAVVCVVVLKRKKA